MPLWSSKMAVALEKMEILRSASWDQRLVLGPRGLRRLKLSLGDSGSFPCRRPSMSRPIHDPP